MAVKKVYHRVGSIWKDDETKRSSISLTLAAPATLMVKQGDKVVEVKLIPNAKGYVNLWLQKPADELDALVANGFITEEVAEERKARLPVGLTHQIILPPPRD